MNLTAAKAADRWLGALFCRAIAIARTLRGFIVRDEDIVRTRTILLIKFWGLGNIVLLLPIVRLLRRRHPDARIVFVSLARNHELLEACADIDERIYIRDTNAATLALSLVAAVWRARRAQPDVAVDFEQFARASVVLATLAGADQVVGLATPDAVRTRLYHKQVRFDDSQHMSQTYMDLARSAGIREERYRVAALAVPEPARASVDAALREADAAAPIVVLHPGSGDNFQGRRWPAASFSALADRLIASHGVSVVVSGTSSERALTARVVAGMNRPDRALDGAGRFGVLELAALLERAALVVANDTAPVHIASSAGTPVIGIYGPNTPRLYGPLSPRSRALYRELPCSPCLTTLNYRTSLCRMPVCVLGITVGEVAEHAAQILTSVPSSEHAPTGPTRAGADPLAE